MSYYYVYVLRSLKDGQMYTGYTADLKNRLNCIKLLRWLLLRIDYQ